MSGRILAGFLAMLLIMVAGAAEPTRVVNAEEILKKIELGQPVEYDNVTIVGDLNLTGLDLLRVPVKRKDIEKFLGLPDYETLVVSPIILTNSVIRDSIDFNAAFFQNVTDFNGTRFEGPAFVRGLRLNQTAGFWGAQFNQTAEFSGSQFNQTAYFDEAKFNQAAYFDGAQFNQTADFSGSQFNQYCNFVMGQFNQTASFQSVQFNQIAEFLSAQFNEIAYFHGAQFNQTAYFQSVLFNETADFSSAWFNQTADFREAWFNQTADFREVQFNQTAFFNDVQFIQTADFSNVQFNKESGFIDAGFLDAFFKNSQFSKEAFFQGAQITGTLSLYRTKYDTINIRWSSIHDLAYDDTAYHLLTQNFNKLGFGDDARECQYSYRCKHREELFRQNKFDLWLFDLLAWATYGYGLRPVRPLGWAALFMLMGGLFFFLTGSVARSKESPSEKRPLALRKREEKPEGSVSIWEALLLSATYFTSGASSIISATPTEFVPQGRGRYVVVILRLLGWIFFVLFLSSLTRTV